MNVDIGLHGLVVRVAGPFHDDIGWNTKGQTIHDEGTSTGMCTDEFPLFLDFVFPLVPLVSCNSDLLVDTRKFTEILQVPVHRLVLDYRENTVVGKGIILVFMKDFACDVVQFD